MRSNSDDIICEQCFQNFTIDNNLKCLPLDPDSLKKQEDKDNPE